MIWTVDALGLAGDDLVEVRLRRAHATGVLLESRIIVPADEAPHVGTNVRVTVEADR